MICMIVQKGREVRLMKGKVMEGRAAKLGDLCSPCLALSVK